MTTSGSLIAGKLLPTFLVKTVTQALLFSEVTAFSSLSADFESRFKPRSAYDIEIIRKYPLCRNILGVLTHTTAWEGHWGGDETPQ